MGSIQPLGNTSSQYKYWDNGWTAGTNNIRLGNSSGSTSQSFGAIAIGRFAGETNQSSGAIAIGVNAGGSSQGPNAIAIGTNAARGNQGDNSIAIGNSAAFTNGSTNIIILNASGNDLSATNSGFFVNPIRNLSFNPSTDKFIYYNQSTSEFFYNTSKPFIIPHPTNQEKYLVHACLEGPEAGIYYRGTAEILDTEVVIDLPDYVAYIGYDFTITLTPIGNFNPLFCSKIIDNKFTVYGEKGEFYWHVYGKRCDIEVEPRKETRKLNNMGPYTWFE